MGKKKQHNFNQSVFFFKKEKVPPLMVINQLIRNYQPFPFERDIKHRFKMSFSQSV